jgi:Peptidase propeptide and YPEB domain
MRKLARWHIWLGWLVGVPLLLWTASGLFMVSFPIEQVRGTDLRAEPPPLPPVESLKLPTPSGLRVERMELQQRIDGPLWVLHERNGDLSGWDAQRDVPLRPVDEALARRIANAALKAPGTIASVRRFPADANPIDLRRQRPAWQVEYGDGVRLYVDAETGEVLAVRTRLWR